VAEKVMSDIGGFPPLRGQDIAPPSIEIARRGLRALFEPGIVVTHNPSRPSSQSALNNIKALGYIMKHYGVRRFLFGGDSAI